MQPPDTLIVRSKAATPQAALELVFDAAKEIEERFDNGVSPSRHDRRTREETHVEAEHDKLVRGERLRTVAMIAIALAVIGGLAWASVGRPSSTGGVLQAASRSGIHFDDFHMRLGGNVPRLALRRKGPRQGLSGKRRSRVRLRRLRM